MNSQNIISTIKDKELEYRAWNLQQSAMLQNPYHFSKSSKSDNTEAPYVFTTGAGFDASENTYCPGYIMEYTGLRDRNKIKMFQWDIVKYAHNWEYNRIDPPIKGEDGKLHVLDMSQKHFVNPKKNNPGYSIGIIEWEGPEIGYAHWTVGPNRMCLSDHIIIEVIGNIFENPELIHMLNYTIK